MWLFIWIRSHHERPLLIWAYSQAHLVYQYWYDALLLTVPLTCAKQWQNKSPKHVPSQYKKNVPQKALKSEKIWFRWGLCLQLSLLTTVCLRGFDRIITQLFLVFSLHQCFQCTVNNKQEQMSISNQHSWVPCCFDACLECQVTEVSKLNFKKIYMQKKYDF